jgi:hypothetical protein
MRLRKGYKIENDRGRVGIITEFGYKNGHKVVCFDGIEGSFDGWCYREQITKVYKPDGTKIY